MTTLTELLDLAYKLGHAAGWQDCESHSEMLEEKRKQLKHINNDQYAAKIIESVCDFYSLSHVEIKSKSRNFGIAMARHAAIYLIRELTTLSLKATGALFSNRDHTTALNSCNIISDLIYTDHPVKRDVEYLREVLERMYLNEDIDIAPKPGGRLRRPSDYKRLTESERKRNIKVAPSVILRPAAEYTNIGGRVATLDRLSKAQ
jgi:hypothetical protein